MTSTTDSRMQSALTHAERELERIDRLLSQHETRQHAPSLHQVGREREKRERREVRERKVH